MSLEEDVRKDFKEFIIKAERDLFDKLLDMLGETEGKDSLIFECVQKHKRNLRESFKWMDVDLQGDIIDLDTTEKAVFKKKDIKESQRILFDLLEEQLKNFQPGE